MTLRKRTLLLILGWLVIASAKQGIGQDAVESAGPPAKTVLLPLAEVHAGMRGVAYTVFSGVRPEPMSVEILGKLKDALGPGRDLILGRLSGSKPEYTGVVAGMSGSPVYINRRLVGALSYRIGQFSKDPIAGITPIEQMLEASGPAIDSSPIGNADVRGGEVQPIEAPLAFGGFSQETVVRFADSFRAMGLPPTSGLGGLDAAKVQPDPLIPGSAVSAVLVSGDLSVTGTCTVSYVDLKRVLACGHPLTQAGNIDVPMAKAEVLATLASSLNSFKIVNATETVGAFTQDRASAISGVLGRHTHLVPVTVTLSSTEAGGVPKTMHFDVANHRELTPQLMTVAIYQCLQQTRTGSTEASYKIDGSIRLAKHGERGESGVELPAVKVEGWHAQNGFNSGAVNMALAVGDRFTQLFSNAEEQPQMLGVDIRVSVSGERRTATLESARASVIEARPGQTLEVETRLQPYQTEPVRIVTNVTLPENLEPGPLRLLVSDGATLDRLDEPAASHGLSLADTVSRLNRTHTNDRVYVTLLTHEPAAFLDATPLAEVPLSMANVFEPLKSGQRLRLAGESMIELGSSPVDDAISGSQILTVIVR